MKGPTYHGWILAFTCTLAVSALGQAHPPAKHPLPLPSDANPQYFPPLVLDRNPEFHEMTARWYASNLRAMSEPSLSQSQDDKSLHVYRFLWLRTFDHPVAVRLTINPDGSGIVSTKITDGAGGYEPGKLIADHSMSLSIREVGQVASLLEGANFWSTESVRRSGGKDGAQWIVEGLKNGNYHIVDRWSPKDESYRRLCLHFLELGKVSEKEIY